MKTVYLKIDDKVLKQSFYDLFSAFGFSIIDREDADFVLVDMGDRICVNDSKYFVKPIDVFSVITELSEDTDLIFGKLSLNQKKRQVVYENEMVLLTDMETKILASLMSDVSGILASDLCINIFSKVDDSCLKSLATHIYNLKKKLEIITKKQKNIILENSRYFLDL